MSDSVSFAGLEAGGVPRLRIELDLDQSSPKAQAYLAAVVDAIDRYLAWKADKESK